MKISKLNISKKTISSFSNLASSKGLNKPQHDTTVIISLITV